MRPVITVIVKTSKANDICTSRPMTRTNYLNDDCVCWRYKHMQHVLHKY